MLLAYELSELDGMFRDAQTQPTLYLYANMYSLLRLLYRKIKGFMIDSDITKTDISMQVYESLQLTLTERLNQEDENMCTPPTLREMKVLQKHLEEIHTTLLETLRHQNYTFITK